MPAGGPFMSRSYRARSAPLCISQPPFYAAMCVRGLFVATSPLAGALSLAEAKDLIGGDAQAVAKPREGIQRGEDVFMQIGGDRLVRYSDCRGDLLLLEPAAADRLAQAALDLLQLKALLFLSHAVIVAHCAIKL